MIRNLSKAIKFASEEENIFTSALQDAGSLMGQPETDSGYSTVVLMVTFDGLVKGLTSGKDSTVFAVDGVAVTATWSGTDGTNIRMLTYTVAAGQDALLEVNETALKAALLGGIHPAAGNAFSYRFEIANTDTPQRLMLNASSIDLSDIDAGTGGFVIHGEADGDSSGYAISSAGDVNGDGLSDLIVGAYGADANGRLDAGKSYVVFGKASMAAVDLSAVANGVGGFAINGQAEGDFSGTSVTSAGDVNGDGLADLIVGAHGANGFAGRSYVVFGKTNTATVDLSAVARGQGGFAINGERSNDASGYAVSSAGDVNGDGLADLMVGASGDNGHAGSSYVVFGKASTAAVNLSAVARGQGGFAIHGEHGGDFSGASLSSAGDVNGDGLADLIVGAQGANDDTGKSYVVFGKANTRAVELGNVANGVGGFVIKGSTAYDRSGMSVANAGDVNGDGLADLIVGADGKSHVVFGKANTATVDLSAVANGDGGFAINGQASDGYSSYTVSSAGDVNGDGLADLIVGAFAVNGIAGRSYVVFGKANTAAVDLSAVANGSGGFAINGQAAFDRSGYSVSSAGDVNGDGLADLIVGAHGANVFAGKSYVVFGKANTAAVDLSEVVNGIGGFAINGQEMFDDAGQSVSSAGDVNGDGLADLIVGARTADANGRLDAGKSYVVFGKANTAAVNLSAVANGVGGFAINGQEWNDRSGAFVSSAGDVNGDGLADLMVGASGDNGHAGSSYVVFGKASTAAVNLSAVANGVGGFAINGQASDDRSEHFVSSAGDVNGDGLADLIVGAPTADPGGRTSAGKSYVIFGSTMGAFSNTAVDFLGDMSDDIHGAKETGQTLVGGAGNDSLSAFGATVLMGGAGNDSLVVEAGMIAALHAGFGAGGNTAILARVDGGSGIDTIRLAGADLRLDLTQVANQAGSNPDGGSRIDSVEAIDLSGSGNNTLKISAADVLDMAGANSFAVTGRHQVQVLGNAGDTLDLTAGTPGWVQSNTLLIGGVGHHIWNHSTTLATLYVDPNVAVVL
jgi:hypothetical protein